MASNQAAKTSVDIDTANNRVVIAVDTTLYPKDAVLGAAYVFIDRCFVLLDALEGTELTISLRGREPLDDAKLGDLSGEFANELLAQTLRQRIADQNRPLLEAVVARAVGGAVGPTVSEPEFDLSELESLDLEDEPFDDPLGIAMSWEDKYGDKRASKAEAAAAKEAARQAAEGEEGGD